MDDRKTWLQGFQPGTFLDHTADTISYSQFVHKARPPRPCCLLRRPALPCLPRVLAMVAAVRVAAFSC